jgi:hypothetical protein
MEELYQLLIGIILLALGIPVGNLLAKITKEELKSGENWFKIIIALSLIGAVISLIINNDTMLFTLLFIAIVTSGSLKR